MATLQGEAEKTGWFTTIKNYISEGADLVDKVITTVNNTKQSGTTVVVQEQPKEQSLFSSIAGSGTNNNDQMLMYGFLGLGGLIVITSLLRKK